MVLDVEKQDVLRQPIIFCGVGRSGTTVISEIVLRHEELAWTSNYQNKFPNCVGINLVRPLTDNKLWRLTGQKRQLNRVPIYNKLGFAELLTTG